MRIRTLYVKISFILTVLLLISLVLFYITISHNYKIYQLEATQHVNRYLASNIIKDKGLKLSDLVQKMIWKKYLVSAMIANPEIDLYFISLQGKILNYAVNPQSVVRQSIAIQPILAFLKKGSALPIYGDNPKSLDRKVMFSTTPVYKNGRRQGYLYIVLNGSSSSRSSDISLKNSGTHRSYILNNMIITVTLVVFFVLLSGLVIVRRITRRIHNLSSDMIEFKDTGFSIVPNRDLALAKIPDEVDSLHQLFYQLAGLTAGHIQELKDKDHARRELVSQICHDIRSPLSALGGYLEILLNNSKASSEQDRLRYLNCSVSQSTRINDLIDDLFLLSMLDDVDYKMMCEVTNVSELISDLVQKYQVLYQSQNFSIESHLPVQAVKVFIDIGLMDRVLSNLIENAIKYSPADGQIDVTVSEITGQCLLSVKNSGNGIAADECKKIFNKYFRTRGSLQTGINGSGLGLTICEKIVELHYGEISVVSDKKGTEFRILLALH